MPRVRYFWLSELQAVGPGDAGVITSEAESLTALRVIAKNLRRLGTDAVVAFVPSMVRDGYRARPAIIAVSARADGTVVSHVIGEGFADLHEGCTYATIHRAVGLIRRAFQAAESSSSAPRTRLGHSHPAPSSNSRRRRHQDSDIPEPTVTVISQGRAIPAAIYEASHERHWTLSARHRVRGHWRSQPCGPGRSLRKRIFVEEHLAGPPDAPIRERVEVVR